MVLHIESSSGVPITRQITDQIRAQCASGKLRPGERLPSVRELARELTVNQNTVLRVYDRLAAEGLLERRHGDGTFVADELPGGQLKEQRLALRNEMRQLVHRARNLGIAPQQLRALLERAISETAEPEPLAVEKNT